MGRNTKPELAVRSLLHRMGYRFRLHKADLLKAVCALDNTVPSRQVMQQ
jgi:G:T-mismatch repair DNA endonuclease (very short patch repair protein)